MNVIRIITVIIEVINAGLFLYLAQRTRKEVVEHINIKVKYKDNKIKKIQPILQGDWVDLRAAETVKMKKGEFKLIPLGIAMQLPKGCEANVVSRSSTFKNFHIIQTNAFGVIDNSYNGDDDWWFYPAYAVEDTVIEKNDRICQFKVVRKQPPPYFKTVKMLNNKNRGGHGSTGVK